MKNYWGSNSIKGSIRQLNAKTFEELYRNYFENGVPSQYTREEYQDLPEEEQKEIKLNAYVTACSFREGTTRRLNENAEFLQLVILDIDNPEEARSVLKLKDTLKDQLNDLNFFVHTTISHTEEAPKLRVVVSVEECDLEYRKGLTRHVANLLGLTTPTLDDDGNPLSLEQGYDSCSTVTSQAFFRPIAFNSDTEGSIIASRVTGRDLTFEEVPPDVFEEFCPEFIYSGDLEFNDDLENLPILDLEMKWVEEALDHLDPDEADETGNTYTPWFKTCCALRHQFREEETAEAAFELFDAWSAKGEKYAGREATYRKWKSFVPCPKGRRPTTIRTLFKRAIKAGWDYSEMVGKVQQGFDEWLETTEDKATLAAEGLARIAAMPFKDENEIIQNDLVARLQKKLKLLGVSGVTTTELKKQLKKEKVKATPKEDPDDKPKWLQPWCYIGADNIYFNTITKAELIPAAFNAMFSRELMHLIPEGQANLSGRPPIAPTDYANNIKLIPRVHGVMYDPAYGGDQTYMKVEGQIYVNRYTPPTVKPIKEDAKEAERIFREWFHWMIRDPKIENMIIDIIAFAAQNPSQKVRIATIFQSVEGVGKTILGEILAHLFGEHNTKQVNAGELDSNYNSFALDVHCIILEELHAAGQNRKKIMDGLKEVVTNNVISVNQKFKNPVKVINRALVFGFTNHIDAIAIDASDRRYFCVKLHPTKEEAEAMSESGYFRQVARLKNLPTGNEEEGEESLVGGIVHFFRNHKVSEGFDPNARAPKTDFRDHLVDSSENPIKAEIKDLISDEDFPLIAEDVISIKALETAFEGEAKGRQLVYFLRELGYVLYTDGTTRRFSVSGRKTSVWYHLQNHDPMFGTPDEILRDRAEQQKLDALDDIDE